MDKSLTPFQHPHEKTGKMQLKKLPTWMYSWSELPTSSWWKASLCPQMRPPEEIKVVRYKNIFVADHDQLILTDVDRKEKVQIEKEKSGIAILKCLFWTWAKIRSKVMTKLVSSNRGRCREGVAWRRGDSANVKSDKSFCKWRNANVEIAKEIQKSSYICFTRNYQKMMHDYITYQTRKMQNCSRRAFFSMS